MDIDRNYTEKVFRFLPESLRNKAVLAGGWVVNPYKAGDIDVWVLTGPHEFHGAEACMIRHLVSMGLASQLSENNGLYESRLAHVVASIPRGYAGLTVQLLVSPVRDGQELVDRFDISTHALACQPTDSAMRLFFAKEWTPTGERPRVLRFDTPGETLARLEKIAARYGTQPYEADVELLRSKGAGARSALAA